MSAPPRIHATQKPTCPYAFLLRKYSPNNFNSDESALELLFYETPRGTTTVPSQTAGLLK